MSSSRINHISSGPPYIMNFIKKNIKKLDEIYKDGMQTYNEGALGMKCSKEKQKARQRDANDYHRGGNS